MKIAIPTNDMITISAHFGRSKGFMIVDVKDNNIQNKEYKVNTFTAHARNNQKEHKHGEHNHSHKGIFTALGNSNVVIARGMGQRLLYDFKDKDITVFITKESYIDDAVKLMIQGDLKTNEDLCCQH